jgi:choline dehydrogenase-like flavoprotein
MDFQRDETNARDRGHDDQDPISFATTLEDEGGPLWGQPLVDAVRKFRHWVGVLAMVNDENNGTVSLDEGGAEAFAADFNDREHGRMDAALAFSRDVLEAAGATRVCWTGLASTHVQGTCRMGSDPERSVVDADARVWGVDRLYVGDGSLVPRTLSVNPSLTIWPSDATITSTTSPGTSRDQRGH